MRLYHFTERLVRLFAHTDINSESEQKCAKTLNEKSVIIRYKRVYRSVFLADLVVELPTTVSREIMPIYAHHGGSSCYVHTTRN